MDTHNKNRPGSCKDVMEDQQSVSGGFKKLIALDLHENEMLGCFERIGHVKKKEK